MRSAQVITEARTHAEGIDGGVAGWVDEPDAESAVEPPVCRRLLRSYVDPSMYTMHRSMSMQFSLLLPVHAVTESWLLDVPSRVRDTTAASTVCLRGCIVFARREISGRRCTGESRHAATGASTGFS